MGEQQPKVIISPRSRNIGKWLFLAIIFLVVVVIGVLSYVHYHNSTPQLSTSSLTNQVNEYNGKGEYQKAISLINKQNKGGVLDQTLLASVYTNAKQYSKALAIYAKLSKTGNMTQSLAESAANIAVIINNKQLAISYYTQAEKLAIGSPTANLYVQYYKNQIQLLEK